MIWLLLACKQPDVTAINDPDRPEHYFDVPFPSDDLAATGHVDLAGWPLAAPQLTSTIEQGWVERLQVNAQGFANLGASYFRFTGHLDLPTATEGLPDDPVLMVALDGSGELLALDVRFVDDPQGDPHYGPNTLAMAPQIGHAPKSGVTYAAVVMKSDQVGPPDAWEADPDVLDALDAAGVKGKPAMATVFTVQDGTGDMQALASAVDANLPDFPAVTWKRVVRLEFTHGETPGGKEATVSTSYFEDGTSRAAYLSYDPDEEQVVDLLDWPMAVYEAEILTLNFQDQDDRPYMSPGLLTINDSERITGWIEIEDGVVTSVPWLEPMRVTVSIPKDDDGEPIANAPVVLWDHGTAGQAYEIVQRPNINDHGRDVAQAFADEGWATIGKDASLYGTRYPLIDEGYGGSLGFYNIVNPQAFRDNQRQTATDALVLRAYVESQLSDDIGIEFDTSRIRRGGHSLGSVTTNLSVAARPDAWESVFLTGTGGYFTDYFLETGLLSGMDPDDVRALFPLFGVTAPEGELTTQSIAGAVLGLQEPAWDHVDRLHPLFTLFQWSMDPSDPMNTGRDETTPIFMTISPGDHQTPDFTAYALADEMPNVTVHECQAQGDYDPHQCVFREARGPELIHEWLQGP